MEENFGNNFKKNFKEEFDKNHENNLEKKYEEPHFNENLKLNHRYQIDSIIEDNNRPPPPGTPSYKLYNRTNYNLPDLFLPCRSPQFSLKLCPRHDCVGPMFENCFALYLRCHC